MYDKTKDVIINPILPNDKESFICFCLIVDQSKFDEELSNLSRLDFIISILSRTFYKTFPLDEFSIKIYLYISQSFKKLINTLFPSCSYDFIDGCVSKSGAFIGSKLKVVDKTNGASMVFDKKHFDELSEIVIKANNIQKTHDTIYVPPKEYGEIEQLVYEIMKTDGNT